MIQRFWGTLRKVLLLILIIVATVLAFKPTGYYPRTPLDCENAIGKLDGCTPTEIKAFSPGNDFEMMIKPKPGEWLYQFPEPGQWFSQYGRSGFNTFGPPRNRLYLQPLGEFGSGSVSLEELRDFTSRFFSAEVQVLEPVAIASLGFTMRKNPLSGQEQVYTRDILEWLKKRVPEDAYCLSAVTMIDLYPDPNWNFVFGEASLNDRIGLFSFVRYDPKFYGEKPTAETPRLMLKRACKVLAHEIGHMYGLYHCVFYKCLMNGSNSLQESDPRPLHECAVCLRKFHFNIKFDLVDRYRRLQEFYQRVGFSDELSWVSRRLSLF